MGSGIDRVFWGRGRRMVVGVLLAVVFAVVGVVIMRLSHAATPFISAEPEQGTAAHGAAVVTDSSASGGKALRFGSVAGGFVHPGIIVDQAGIDFVKAKIAANQEPWKSELAKTVNAKPGEGSNAGIPFSSASYVPHPTEYITCGNNKQGCLDETDDAQAAYTNALLWAYTGDRRYARQSITILNAWSAKLKDHKMSTTDPALIGGVLNAAWAGQIFPRAAEIMRYTYTPGAGEPALNVANMERMLRDAFLPWVRTQWAGGGHNWVTSMAEATINIGVFLSDREVFDDGIGDWRGNTPANIYMSGDVNPYAWGTGLPLPIPNTKFDKATMTAANFRSEAWWGATTFPSGMQGETCRDLNHTAMGVAGMVNAAETARIQGIDLYGEQKARITTMLELETGFLNAVNGGTARPAGWPCPNNPVLNGGERVTYVMAYNHYAKRLGMSLPNTNAWITTKIMPSSYRANNTSQYEPLTSWGTP